jgi:hypothetical protein
MNIRKRVSTVFSIIFILLLLVSFSLDLQNTIEYGGIDLRTRVVGTRVFLAGKDPYFFNWKPGMPDTLLDPLVEPNAKGSRLTVPPSVLLLHAPFANQTYFQQKIIWLGIQWLSLILIILIFALTSKSLRHLYLIFIVSLFFIYSFFWRFHVERSQLYILYTCLLALSWVTYRARNNLLKYLSGLTLGFTICLRPPAIFVLIPFIVHRRLSMLVGAALGILLGLALPVSLSGLSIWNSYASSMKNITQHLSIHKIPDNINAGNTIIKNEPYLKIIEGLNVASQNNNIPAVNTALQKNLMNLGLDNIHELQNSILILYLILFCIFLIKNHRKLINSNLIFLQGIVAYLIVEFIIPSPRYSYNDVQWLLPLLLILNEIKEIRFLTSQATILLIISLFLCVGAFLWIPKFLLISIFMMTIYVVSTTYGLLQQKMNRE